MELESPKSWDEANEGDEELRDRQYDLCDDDEVSSNPLKRTSAHNGAREYKENDCPGEIDERLAPVPSVLGLPSVVSVRVVVGVRIVRPEEDAHEDAKVDFPTLAAAVAGGEVAGDDSQQSPEEEHPGENDVDEAAAATAKVLAHDDDGREGPSHDPGAK